MLDILRDNQVAINQDLFVHNNDVLYTDKIYQKQLQILLKNKNNFSLENNQVTEEQDIIPQIKWVHGIRTDDVDGFIFILENNGGIVLVYFI